MLQEQEITGLINLADKYYQEKKYAKALEIYQSASIDYPENTILHEGLAKCFYRLGKSEDAKKECESLIKLHKNSWMAHYILGLVLAEEGDFEESEKYYRATLNIKPDAVFALNSLGMLLYDQKKLDESLQVIHKASQLDPDNSQIHSNLAEVYRALKQFSNALTEDIKAFRINPSIKTSLWVLISFEHMYRKYIGRINIALLIILSVFKSLLLIPLAILFVFSFLLRAAIWFLSGDRTKGILAILVGLLVVLWYSFRIR